jgi:hypothetical protein
MLRYPFEASIEEIRRDPDPYIDAVFSCLESEFTVMPKGPGFVEYPVFEQAYEALKAATEGFSQFPSAAVRSAVTTQPVTLLVLRTMLGFSPPEWAYVATRHTGISLTQGFVRSLDKRVRNAPERPPKPSARIDALVETACHALAEGAPTVAAGELHRLDTADTSRGTASIKAAAALGVPYAMLLYERLLGRPFAAHRDSVSELVGDRLEAPIEDLLMGAGISYRKTKRAERIAEFDQAPDFVVPSEFNPQVVIEAKISEDDGTARNKVTRIQHLGELSEAGGRSGGHRFEVVACIGGRGFGVRRNDMKKMLIATRGKVFTLKTFDRMVENTRLKEYRTR